LYLLLFLGCDNFGTVCVARAYSSDTYQLYHLFLLTHSFSSTLVPRSQDRCTFLFSVFYQTLLFRQPVLPHGTTTTSAMLLVGFLVRTNPERLPAQQSYMGSRLSSEPCHRCHCTRAGTPLSDGPQPPYSERILALDAWLTKRTYAPAHMRKTGNTCGQRHIRPPVSRAATPQRHTPPFSPLARREKRRTVTRHWRSSVGQNGHKARMPRCWRAYRAHWRDYRPTTPTTLAPLYRGLPHP